MLSTPDQEIIRQDPDLPGLPILFDPGVFADVIRPHVPELDVAEAVYVRYKQGENAIVAFRLYAHGTAHWAYAKAHRADATAKLVKAVSRPEVASPLGPGRVVLPAWATTVSFLPNDDKLKSLRRLQNAQGRYRLMSSLMPDRPDLWEPELELLRYKPERRFVARIGDTVLKLHTESGFPGAYGERRTNWARGALKTAPVIGRSERHRALVYPWVEGRVMDNALRDPACDLKAVAPVGMALATLHKRCPEGPSVQKSEDIAQALFAAAEAVGITSPALAGRANSLASRISVQLAAPKRLALLHGDFYAKQILLSQGTPTILDFDRMCLGDPAADFGTFLAHLERDRVRYTMSAARIDAIRTDLLDGYLAVKDPPTDELLALHTASAILQLAPHPFRFREPEWRARTTALLDAAEEQLDAALRCSSSQSVSARRPATVSDPYDAASDDALPQLGRALDPDIAARCMETFSDQLAGKRGTLALEKIQVVRHRPGRRALVKYTMQTEGPDSQANYVSLFGKVRTRGFDRTAFSLNTALWRRDFGPLSRDEVVVPEPIGVWPEARMWLQHEAVGRSATVALKGTDGVRVARRIAYALAKLHREGPVPHRRHSLANELALLHDRLPHVAVIHPRLSSRINRVLAACDRLAASFARTRMRPLHRDFYPDNILVSDDHITLLDLDLYALGDPALDAGNFIGHLIEEGLRERGDPAAYMGVARAFEDMFASLEGQSIRVAVWAYTTLSLVRHLFISTRIASRRASTGAILDLCEERLLGTAAMNHFSEV